MTTYGPLLWTDVTSLSYDSKRYLMRMSSSVHHVAVFGGDGSGDASVTPRIGAAIGVTTHYPHPVALSAGAGATAGPHGQSYVK